MKIINDSPVESVPLEKLNLHPNNPRKGNLDALSESLDVNGFYGAIVAQKSTGYILAGNHRYMAASAKKAQEIPVIWVDVDDDQAKKILLADNRTSDLAVYDEDELSTLLKSLDDLDGTGYTEEDLDALVGETSEGADDVEPTDPPEEPQSKLGEVYELGPHRLICGDCTKEETLDVLLNGNFVDVVFSDPPYGIDIVSSNTKKVGGDKATTFTGTDGAGKWVEAKKYAKIEGDETTEASRLFYELCKKKGIERFFLWGGNYFTDFLPPSMCWLVWDKQNTGNFADVELAWSNENKSAKLYKWLWNGLSRKGDRASELISRVHPTQKPVGLFVLIFRDFEFSSCLDGFLGSGSTLIASAQTGRVCYGCEISPAYCDVIRKRWTTWAVESGKDPGSGALYD